MRDEGMMSQEKPVKVENRKPRYEKPLFEKQPSLNFPEKIWERLNGGKFSMTCSRCHHCR